MAAVARRFECSVTSERPWHGPPRCLRRRYAVRGSTVMNRDIRPLPIPPADRAALAAAGGIVRFVAGLDPSPRPMTAAEIEALLNDPLAVLLLRRGVFPRTLAE